MNEKDKNLIAEITDCISTLTDLQKATVLGMAQGLAFNFDEHKKEVS